MTYEQAMQFWFGRLNYEVNTPRPRDLSLERIRLLLGLLGNPQDRLRIIHIAGSKGKGSTSALLASILQKAGYRTGLFTSPHLVDVTERIQVDRVPISPEELAQLMEEIRAVAQAQRGPESGLDRTLTFFEIATALGFLHFARRRVEPAVIEVGLGGRFDSTNVCRPLVSIITSISLDHMEYLGETLAQIAMEKAGIVKTGRPCLSGVRFPAASAVIERICAERHAPLQRLGVDFHYRHEPACLENSSLRPAQVQVSTGSRVWPAMKLGLIGAHQARNAALAVAAVEELRRKGLTIRDSAVAAGLAGVHWPARLEVVSQRPLVLLDCAHNVASAEALVEALQASFPPPAGRTRRGFLIFAGSRDKDLAGMLRVLAPHFSDIALTRFVPSPRSATPEELGQMLPPGTKADLFPTAREAWLTIRSRAADDDLICVTGSVFLAGELRQVMMSSS